MDVDGLLHVPQVYSSNLQILLNMQPVGDLLRRLIENKDYRKHLLFPVDQICVINGEGNRFSIAQISRSVGCLQLNPNTFVFNLSLSTKGEHQQIITVIGRDTLNRK